MRDDTDADLAGGEDPAPLAVAGRERPAAAAWAGAGLSLLVLAGLGLWVEDLLTRDTGRVPIIAARIGPVKTAAEDGPAPIAHRDVESYALGAPDGPGAAAEARFAPATPAPSEEDVALGAMPMPAPREEPAPAAEETRLAEIDPAAVTDAGGEAEPGASAESAPDAEPGPAGPVPPQGTGSDLAPVATAPAPARPGDLAERMAAARRAAEAERASLERAAADAPYQLQLGAFRTEALTRGAWERIANRHSELLYNRRLAVQTTTSGGETFYRLRVGPFTSLAEAASLCEALRARGQDCIPAANR